MYYPRYPCQDWGCAPMLLQWPNMYPPYNGYYDNVSYPIGNGCNQPAQNIQQPMIGQQQGNHCYLHNQGPAFNYNTAVNGNNGGVYGNSFNQTAWNVPQIMAGQYQAHPPQQMQQGNPNAFPNQGNPNAFPNQGNHNAFPNQGNPNLLPNQGPVSNYNTASNGYNGGVYGNSFNQTAGNVPQIMAGQYQAHPPQQMQQAQQPQQMQQGNPNQGNPNLVPYQRPASNYNTAYNGNYGFPYAQTNGYLNNQPPQNSLQMNCGQNQVALTSGNQQMQQLSHDNNSISRGGVTENPGMAVECVTKLCEAVTNSINGNGTKDPITLKLNIPKFGMEMNFQKGSENGSNVSSAIEKE